MVFILTRHFRVIKTFNEDFKVYSTSSYSYRFDESSLNLVYKSLPKEKNEDNSKCIIF